MYTHDTFVTALNAFVDATQARLNSEYARDYKGRLTAPKITFETGRKNVRIVANGPGQRSVFCFVRIADGAILKADGWQGPAKHARGSIYVNAGQDAVGTFGANYLR